MKKYVYNIVGDFTCSGEKMLVVKTTGATCVMLEREYNKIVLNERKHEQHTKLKAS